MNVQAFSGEGSLVYDLLIHHKLDFLFNGDLAAAQRLLRICLHLSSPCI